MLNAKKYLFFGLPLLAFGIILLAVSLPLWATTSLPPVLPYQQSYDEYHLGFYLSIIGGFILAGGLICIGIYRSSVREEQKAQSK